MASFYVKQNTTITVNQELVESCGNFRNLGWGQILLQVR